MPGLPLRKLDRLVLLEFIPFFLMGMAAFTLLMVAATMFRDIMKYVTDYGLSFSQVGTFFILALPQTISYTFPMAILFAGLLCFGRLSDTSQITAIRAGGVGFFRIVLPALVFSWFIVLATFILSEKVAPQSTIAAKQYIRNALVSKGITLAEENISYMDEKAGWLFAAAKAEGNVFYDVKWWDFAVPGEMTLYIAEEGTWESDEWVFRNLRAITMAVDGNEAVSDILEKGANGDTDFSGNGEVVHVLVSPKLEMKIARTPSDLLTDVNRDPEEMSLQELYVWMRSPSAHKRTEQYLRKLEGTYHLKIAAPFMSIVFILIAAPLGMAPQRSTSTLGIGLSMLLVFGYYLLMTFSVKIGESGWLNPIVAAWLPNALFLAAGIWLNARFYMRSS